MSDFSFFNSKECEWSDMTVNIGGAPVGKIRGLKYKTSKDKTLLHAAGDKPISIQSGNRTFEGEIKLLKGTLDAMNIAAIAAQGQDVLDLEFDVVVTYRAAGSRALQVDTLLSVQVTSMEKGWDQGAKEMEITLPILFLDLLQA